VCENNPIGKQLLRDIETMNLLQSSYAKGDNSLAALLVAIEATYGQLPPAVQQAFDQLGSAAPRGCHCDLEEGEEPDGCVLDEGRPQDFVYARGIDVKNRCQFWQPITIKR